MHVAIYCPRHSPDDAPDIKWCNLKGSGDSEKPSIHGWSSPCLLPPSHWSDNHQTSFHSVMYPHWSDTSVWHLFILKCVLTTVKWHMCGFNSFIWSLMSQVCEKMLQKSHCSVFTVHTSLQTSKDIIPIKLFTKKVYSKETSTKLIWAVLALNSHWQAMVQANSFMNPFIYAFKVKLISDLCKALMPLISRWRDSSMNCWPP